MILQLLGLKRKCLFSFANLLEFIFRENRLSISVSSKIFANIFWNRIKFCEKTAKQYKPRAFAPVLHTFSRKLSGKQIYSHKSAQNKYFCEHFRKNIAKSDVIKLFSQIWSLSFTFSPIF
jgi:hypothetical protein